MAGGRTRRQGESSCALIVAQGRPYIVEPLVEVIEIGISAVQASHLVPGAEPMIL
jgi:GTP:adenosylcobinamide-phosphate guanylyltransferase